MKNASESMMALLGKSLRSRALMANALCVVAEEEAESGYAVRAAQTAESVRRVLRDIEMILNGDTDELPIDALEDAAQLLAGLDGRIRAVETRLRPALVR